MTHNGIELQSMTYNGQEVNSWVHNGVEVFTAEREIYRATLGYVITTGGDVQNNIPKEVTEVTFIDTDYITDTEGIAYVDSISTTVSDVHDYGTIGTPTSKALSRYKYAKIYYEVALSIYRTSSEDYGHKARCSLNGNQIAYISKESYPDSNKDYPLTEGIMTIPIEKLNSTAVLFAYSKSRRQGDQIYAGIGVTKIVLTNKEPTE